MSSLKFLSRALPVMAAVFALSVAAPAFAQTTPMAPSSSTMAPSSSTMAPAKPAKMTKAQKKAAAAAAKAKTAETAAPAAPAAAGGAMAAPMASSKKSTSKMGAGRFTSEAEAKATCPTDTVVWASSKSKAYHVTGSKFYGKTKSGAYECKSAADSAGYHAAKN